MLLWGFRPLLLWLAPESQKELAKLNIQLPREPRLLLFSCSFCQACRKVFRKTFIWRSALLSRRAIEEIGKRRFRCTRKISRYFNCRFPQGQNARENFDYRNGFRSAWWQSNYFGVKSGFHQIQTGFKSGKNRYLIGTKSARIGINEKPIKSCKTSLQIEMSSFLKNFQKCWKHVHTKSLWMHSIASINWKINWRWENRLLLVWIWLVSVFLHDSSARRREARQVE